MYSIVPMTAPTTVAAACVIVSSMDGPDDADGPVFGPEGIDPTREVERAIPKSMMIACSFSTITFAGLRSR